MSETLREPVPLDGMSPIHVYVLPPNTVLYRGFPKVVKKRPAGDTFYFVTTSEDSAKSYGVVFPVTTRREYRLLAIDHAGTMEALYQNAPLNIKKILDENYGRGKSRRKKRLSVFEKDVTFSKWVCETQHVDGYATRKMENGDHGRGDFHEEIMICDTSKLHVGDTKESDEKIDQIVSGHKQNEITRQMRENQRNLKRSRRHFDKSKSPQSLALFPGLSDFSPSPKKSPSSSPSPKKSSPQHQLFPATPGGGRITRRRRRSSTVQ